MWNSVNHFHARLPDGHPPVLTVIVDTEEDFDWSAPYSRHSVETKSISGQAVAHERIFRKFRLVPTYVIDWPIATSKNAMSILSALMSDGECEIGTHLHPWVSPPYSEALCPHNSYAGNLPPALEFEKLRLLTEAIEGNLGRRPTIFKAGRYGLGKNTLDSIKTLGYTVDASVVPYTTFTADGGPDFTDFDWRPFWVGTGSEQLLELPVTTGFCGSLSMYGKGLYPKLQTTAARTFKLGGIAARLGILERIRLTPEGCNIKELIRITDSLLMLGGDVLTLTYHSPSLVPGNTPYVRSAGDLVQFLTTIEHYCQYFHSIGGIFLSVTELQNRLLNERLRKPAGP